MARDRRLLPAPVGAPAAVRATRPGWRDPRLWVGVAIVAICVVAGSRVLASADDTVQVWAVDADLQAGVAVSPSDLVAHRVHFEDAADLSAYYPTSVTLPADLHLARPVGAGELLPRAAVGAPSATADTVQVPIAVDDEQVPPSVEPGSVVDVYLLGGDSSPGARISPVLASVTVVEAPSLADSFGTTGQRQLVLAVPEQAVRTFFSALAAVDDPSLTVVRRS